MGRVFAPGLAPEEKWLLAFVLLVSLTIDFSTDTPCLPGKWLGPFYRLGPATQFTSAACAAVLCLLALLPLIGVRRRNESASSVVVGASVVLRLLPLTSMLFAFFWSRPQGLWCSAQFGAGRRSASPW